MNELRWFALSLPRDMDIKEVTAVLRPLASRPRGGLIGATPLAVLEVWGQNGAVSWRLGLDERIARDMPSQMSAHLPRLGIVPVDEERPALTLAAEVHMVGFAHPLRSDMASAVSAGTLAVLRELRKGESGVIQWLVGPSRQGKVPPSLYSLAETLGLRAPQKPDSTAMRLWREKASESLYACRGRVGAFASTPARAYVITKGLGDALKLSNTAHAAFRLGKATRSRAARVTSVALRPLTWRCLLNASELAGLVGWPLKETPTDGLPIIGGHINEVPRRLLVSEADEHSGERVLGESLHPAQGDELVTMLVSSALHHCHVIGPTGSGKSTLLAGLITADIAAGRSLLVVEPRGDLVRDVLARVPDDRRERVVVIDPALERSVGFNVLAGERADAERRADEIVHLLSELHGGNLGPRSADIALHAFITASRLPDGTLCDVPALLTNPAFRRQALAKVNDPMVLGPWWAGFEARSEAEKAQHVTPLLNKLRPFTSRDVLRRMVGQAEPRFRLDKLFTKPGMIVLVNLNRGLLGAPVANLLGALLLSQAWAAIQRRAALPPEKRHPVMAVVDEFQDYLRLSGGVDFGDALAQSRGLGVSWTLAHQHLDQLSASQQAAVLANARSRIVFRPANADAKPLASTLGGGLTGDDILRLKAFEACCSLLVDGQPTRPFSVRTRPLPPWTSNPDELMRQSAQRYGVDGAELDAALAKRWQEAGGGDGPVGVKRRRGSS